MRNEYYSQCLKIANYASPTTNSAAPKHIAVDAARKCGRKGSSRSVPSSTPISDSIGHGGASAGTDIGNASGSDGHTASVGQYSRHDRQKPKVTSSTLKPSSSHRTSAGAAANAKQNPYASPPSSANSNTNGGGSGSTQLTTKGPIMQGKTTRYWDCCKPSCSDPANTGAVSKPVGTCQKDGTTPAGPNDKSGCQGGNAFTCNSNQPFISVNSTMAYGFAAASIQGMSEKDRCCACFKIDFTSGAVAGKSMVVQITNSGGDLGYNQFDLQIPGGGVGLFNGCSPQWNAPYPDAWGGKYGGVYNLNDCSQLPKQLQAGCQFRFQDFFQTSDNPTMNFQRVTCPVELTDKTGCKRNDDN